MKKSFNKPLCVSNQIQKRLVGFKNITDNLGMKSLKSHGAVEQLHTDLAMAQTDWMEYHCFNQVAKIKVKDDKLKEKSEN